VRSWHVQSTLLVSGTLDWLIPVGSNVSQLVWQAETVSVIGSRWPAAQCYRVGQLINSVGQRRGTGHEVINASRGSARNDKITRQFAPSSAFLACPLPPFDKDNKRNSTLLGRPLWRGSKWALRISVVGSTSGKQQLRPLQVNSLSPVDLFCWGFSSSPCISFRSEQTISSVATQFLSC